MRGIVGRRRWFLGGSGVPFSLEGGEEEGRKRKRKRKREGRGGEVMLLW